MRSTSAIAFLATVGLGVSVLAVEPKTRVERVVVFADRAEVTRTTTATCNDGKAEAVFEPLPVGVDPRTFRAEASGKATAIGTASRMLSLDPEGDNRIAVLLKDLQKLENQIQEVKAQRSGFQERISSVSAFESYFQSLLNEELRNAKVDPRQWTRVLDLVTTDRLETSRKHVDLNVKQRKLTRHYERLVRQLANLRALSGASEARAATVTVDCGGESRPKVSLAYVVPGATWHPEYDLRFFPAGNAKVGSGKVELTVGAVVQQSTGEDWADAQLVLSTAKPKLGAEAPYPAPLFVDGFEVGKTRVLVTSMERREALQGPAATPTGAGATEAAIEDKGQSVVFLLPRPATIMADGRPYWMPVDMVSGAGESKLVTIPSRMPFVYQVVALKNPAAYPLLAGRIHSYRGGSYVGDSSLAYKAAGEPMDVSLGFDEELRVERKDLLEKDRRAGFLSGTKHLERAYRIKVINRATGRVQVEVRENIPVSKNEDVLVELIKDKTTKGFSLDNARGMISWKLDLDRGVEKFIDLTFTVHLPKDWEVAGQ